MRDVAFLIITPQKSLNVVHHPSSSDSYIRMLHHPYL